MENKFEDKAKEEIIFVDNAMENNQSSLRRNIEIKNIFLKVVDLIIFFYSLPFIYFIASIEMGLINGEAMMAMLYFLPFLPLVLIQMVISLIRIKKIDLFDKIFWFYSLMNAALFFMYLF